MTVADDERFARAIAERVANEPRVRLDVTADAEVAGDPVLQYWVNSPDADDWFGMSAAFDLADDIYLTTVAEGVQFAGFHPRPSDPLVPSTGRKTITNAGAVSFEVYNFRLDDDAGDAVDPGMVQGRRRTLLPGESLRLQWDPIGLRWLVNDGLESAEVITHDGVPVTHDDDTITHPEI